MPVSLHFGSGGFVPGFFSFSSFNPDPPRQLVTDPDSDIPPLAMDSPFAVAFTLFNSNLAWTTVDLLLSGKLQRFPKLQIALSEGGIGWVPYILERTDFVWERHRYYQPIDFDTRPSDLWRDHFWGLLHRRRARRREPLQDRRRPHHSGDRLSAFGLQLAELAKAGGRGAGQCARRRVPAHRRGQRPANAELSTVDRTRRLNRVIHPLRAGSTFVSTGPTDGSAQLMAAGAKVGYVRVLKKFTALVKSDAQVRDSPPVAEMAGIVSDTDSSAGGDILETIEILRRRTALGMRRREVCTDPVQPPGNPRAASSTRFLTWMRNSRFGSDEGVPVYRTIQWANGNVGCHAPRTIVEGPDFEPVGLRVYDPAMVGKDAGALVGIEPMGVMATYDVADLLALDADRVCYTRRRTRPSRCRRPTTGCRCRPPERPVGYAMPS